MINKITDLGYSKLEAQELLNTTCKNIDKAQNINIVHKNKGARLKSRLTKSVNNLKY